MFQKAISLLRIFDLAKAEEVYIGWLALHIYWQHWFEENMPYTGNYQKIIWCCI